MIIFLLNFKRNKKLYEHLTSDGNLTDIERNLLTNIVSRYKNNNLTLNNIRFRTVGANNLILNKDNYSFSKFIFPNKLTTKNLNIPNDISSNNLTVSNDLSANTFITNNIQSNTSRINTINGEIIAENIILSEITTDKLCIDSSCITAEQYANIKKYFDPVNKYMYKPNTPGKNDQNIIWNDLKDKIINNNTDGVIKAVGDTMDMGLQVDTNNGPWPTSTDKKGIPGAKNIYTYTTRNSSGVLGKGLEIRIPNKPVEMDKDFTVLWVQVLGERLSSFRVYEWDEGNKTIKKDFGNHIAGASAATPVKRILNTISPDGTVNQLTNNTDGTQYFTWWPVPIDLSGNTSRKLMITFNMDKSEDYFYDSTINPKNPITDPWISGLAFSKNPWNHCPINHFSLQRRANNKFTYQYNHNVVLGTGQNFDFSYFTNNTTTLFRIPYINSGKDKVFYIIGTSNSFPSIKAFSFTTNNMYFETIKNNSGFLNTGKFSSFNNKREEIENGGFVTTLNNPFANHFNSKSDQRYYAIIIPKEKLPLKKSEGDFLELRITMGKSSDISGTSTLANGFAFTEVGTHDLHLS
jgi:hypothetical protein